MTSIHPRDSSTVEVCDSAREHPHHQPQQSGQSAQSAQPHLSQQQQQQSQPQSGSQLHHQQSTSSKQPQQFVSELRQVLQQRCERVRLPRNHSQPASERPCQPQLQLAPFPQQQSQQPLQQPPQLHHRPLGLRRQHSSQPIPVSQQSQLHPIHLHANHHSFKIARPPSGRDLSAVLHLGHPSSGDAHRQPPANRPASRFQQEQQSAPRLGCSATSSNSSGIGLRRHSHSSGHMPQSQGGYKFSQNLTLQINLFKFSRLSRASSNVKAQTERSSKAVQRQLFSECHPFLAQQQPCRELQSSNCNGSSQDQTSSDASSEFDIEEQTMV
ncbi:hypothetical protein WR25_16272 [Diploscapter pachys]|uniref:Uncharacterized protein n=1 Tax=Diploscapter pachys TaxID=2018661 RepID=A0A2A2L8G1_9BILA|nr:hypothetical protein WR25_16272 [Diploscapter pachys]